MVEHLCEFHLCESTSADWENSKLIFLYLELDVLIFNEGRFLHFEIHYLKSVCKITWLNYFQFFFVSKSCCYSQAC